LISPQALSRNGRGQGYVIITLPRSHRARLVNKFKDARDEEWLRRTIELALEFIGRRRRSARDAAFDVVEAALKEFLRSLW
jgi:hypothetical protein